MAFSDNDFVALNLPEGVSFARNGVTTSVADCITAALDEKGSRERALVLLFTMLESDHFKSEVIDKYSYEKWGMRGSEWWQARADAMGMDANPPDVTYRPRGGGRWGIWP